MNYDCSALINSDYQILDVTLRDGGCRNQWSLSEDELLQVIGFLASLPVNLIEVGYICDQGKYGCNGSLEASSLALIRNLMPRDKKIAVMLFESEPDPIHCLQSRLGFIDLVRLTTNGRDLESVKAIVNFCRIAGLEYSLNITKASTYGKDELLRLMPALLALGAKVIYFADSRGSMYPQSVYSLIKASTANYPDQAFGFHAHDNLSLAFMNSAAAIAAGSRYLDSSLCGMGMGAGNLVTELLLFYIHQQSDKLPLLIESIVRNIEVYRLMGLEHEKLKYVLSGILNIAQENASEAKNLQAILGMAK